MRRLTWFICMFFLCAVSQALAAEPDADTTGVALNDTTFIADPVMLPANSTGDLDFAVDAAGFKGSEGKTYEELYLMLRPSQFTLEQQKNKTYRGNFQIEAVIYDEAGLEIHRITEQRVYETDQPVLISRRGEERVAMDLLAMNLAPGAYRADVTVTDLYSDKKGTGSKHFVADPYDGNVLYVSDIQFSTRIQADSLTHRFTKNGLLILPNPSRVFEKWAELPSDGSYKPKVMYFYFEMYNFADASDAATSTYDIDYAVISHASGAKFAMPTQKDLTKPGSSGAKVLAVDINSFPPDVYTLELTVSDHASGEAVTRRCIFEVVQPPPPPPPVTVLTEEQAERGYRMIKFLASKRDLNVYEKLDLKGKTEFLINFWKERDPTPTTPENEFMIVFNERFSFAEYTLGGAESDRGRIFMKYGEPEDVERHDSDNEIKPYEIWYYTSGVNSDASRTVSGGRDFFIFGDRGGYGRYELLHSSAVGENYNPEWKRELLQRSDYLEPRIVEDPSEKPGGEP